MSLDWSASCLERAERRSTRSWWYQHISWSLFFNDYDPFEIFELRPDDPRRPKIDRFSSYQFAATTTGSSSHHSSSNSMPNSRMLNSQSGRRRFASAFRAFVTYFLVKASVLTLLTRDALAYKLDLAHKSLLSPELASKLNAVIGNPLVPLGDMAILLYFGSAGAVFYLGVLMPHYYNHRRAMDVSGLRFLLRPSLELARVDRLTSNKLRELSASVENFTRSPLVVMKLASSRRSRRIDHIHDLATYELVQVHSQRLQSRLGAMLGEPAMFRPHNYSRQWFRWLERNFPRYVAFYYSFIASWFVYILGLMYLNFECTTTSTKSSSGESLAAGDAAQLACESFKFGSSFQENLTILEQLLAIVLCYQLLSFHICQLTLVLCNHFKLIKSTRCMLQRCLHRLEWIDEQQQQWRQRRRRRQVDTLDPMELDRLKAELMLDLLARMAIFEHETAVTARCLSRLVVYFAYPLAAQLFFFFITAQMATKSSELMRKLSLLFIWLLVNAVGLICSYIPGKLVHIETICWSIAARSAHNELQYRWNHAELAKHYDATSFLWHKFLARMHLNRANYCACPLNISITYGRLIEVDFFVILVYSLLQKFL